MTVISMEKKAHIEALKDHILFSSKVDDHDKIELKFHLDELADECKRIAVVQQTRKLGNPAAVGLAGYGISTLMLQFHIFGWMGVGPVLWVALIYGGIAQMIAGLMEFATGNNFGFCAFTTYGAFWMSFVLIHLDKAHPVNEQDMAMFLIAFTIYTFIMFVASTRENIALATLFFQLLVGLVLLDFANFYPEVTGLKTAAGCILVTDALTALYIMAHIIFLDTFKRDVLPVGPPLNNFDLHMLHRSVSHSQLRQQYEMH